MQITSLLKWSFFEGEDPEEPQDDEKQQEEQEVL